MLERDLVNNMNSYLNTRGVRYTNELRMGIGISDISLNLGAYYRLKQIDDYFLLAIQTFIHKNRAVTFDEIRKKFLLSVKQVKWYVFSLADLNLVKIKNHLVTSLKNIFSTNLGTLISIEVKLKDWKGACLQAQRYLWFSDYAYVAMPDGYIKNVDKKLFEESSIGLLSVSGKQLQEVIPAKRSESCDFIQKYLATSKIMGKYNNFTKKPLQRNVFSSYATT